MLWKIHGTNFFHIKFLGCTIIKCQNGPVLAPAQVYYFYSQALLTILYTVKQPIENKNLNCV
jgi:hypothetical protein